MLKDKTVVIGVSGGIAVYKTLDVVSRLRKLGVNVNVIMTNLQIGICYTIIIPIIKQIM